MTAIVTAPGDADLMDFLAALRRVGGGIQLIRSRDIALATLAKRLGYVHLPEGRPVARLTGLGQSVLDRAISNHTRQVQ